jgi:hypothetical protein
MLTAVLCRCRLEALFRDRTATWCLGQLATSYHPPQEGSFRHLLLARSYHQKTLLTKSKRTHPRPTESPRTAPESNR